MLIYILLSIGVVGLCYSLLINRLSGLPPGPPPLPVIGNVLSLFSGDSEALDKKMLEWKQRYGNVFTLWVPTPMVFIADHKVMMDAVVREGDAFAERMVGKELNRLAVGGDFGLVMNANEMWKEQRRFALHALRDVGFGTSAVEDCVSAYAHEAVTRWKAEDGKEIDVTPNIMAAVANTIWRLDFGKTLQFDDPLFARVRQLFDEMFPLAICLFVMLIEVIPPVRHIDFLFGGKLGKLIRLNDQIEAIVNKEVDEAAAALGPDDEPNCYVQAYLKEMRRREDKGEELGTFTRHQLGKAASDIWGAGFETTVTTMRYGIHYLINYPEVQRKMQKEIDDKIGDRIIRMEDQRSLPYCCAAIQEIQRLANILPLNIFRRVVYDTTVDGHRLKAGTTVIPQFQAVHMNPEEFERPEYFCPDRFLDDNGDFVKDPRVTPFSVGKRSCLGENLARMEIFVLLTTFMQHVSFSSTSVVPPKLNVVFGFTRSPKPYTVIVHDRTKNK